MVSFSPVPFNDRYGSIFDSEKDLDEYNLNNKTFQTNNLIEKMNEDTTFGLLCFSDREEYSEPMWITDQTFHRNGVWDRFTFYRGDYIKELHDKVTKIISNLKVDMQNLYERPVDMNRPFQNLRDRRLRLLRASEVIESYQKAYEISVGEQQKFVDNLPPWTETLYKIIDWCLSRFSESSSPIEPTITMEKPFFLPKTVHLGDKPLGDSQEVEVIGSVDFETCATKVTLVPKLKEFESADEDKPTLTLRHAWKQVDKIWMESQRTDDQKNELSEPHLRGEITSANTAEEDFLESIALEIFDLEKLNKLVLKMPNDEETEYTNLAEGESRPEKTGLFQSKDANPILPRFFHLDGTLLKRQEMQPGHAHQSYIESRELFD